MSKQPLTPTLSPQAGRGSQRPKPRLYLATPPLPSAGAFASKLVAAIADIDVAAVLLRLADGDDATLLRIVDALASPLQKTGAALLIDGHAQIAAASRADGIHLADPAALPAVLGAFKPDSIVGAGGLHSRHEAMVAAEQGADYVVFGEPDTSGARPSHEAVIERVAWWAELFEPPCVAYAATREEARDFAAAGADFVLVDDLAWNDVRGVHAGLMDAAAAIGQS